MRVIVKSGDVLDEAADVLVCPANAHLNLSGGVNGAILLRGGLGVQRELHDWLARQDRPWVPPGTIVRTGPGPLRVRHSLNAVALDAFYTTTPAILTRTIGDALAEAARLGAGTVAMAALATGYGRVRMATFATAFKEAAKAAPGGIAEVRVVVRHEDEAAVVRDQIGDWDDSAV